MSSLLVLLSHRQFYRFSQNFILIFNCLFTIGIVLVKNKTLCLEQFVMEKTEQKVNDSSLTPHLSTICVKQETKIFDFFLKEITKYFLSILLNLIL